MKKYERIFANIVEKIETGAFKEGEQIYTEKEIKNLYSVSSTTAVRVLSELENRGYIFRVQGKGSFVSKTLANKKVYFTESNNFQKYFNEGEEESSKVIGLEIVQDRDFCNKVGMEPSQLLKITRVKYIGDLAWAYQINYISMKYLPNMDIGDIDSFKELATMIRKNYHIDIHRERSKKKIKVRRVVPENVAFYIAKEKEPCFEFDRFTYMPNGDIFEYVKIYINYKYYEIEIND